MSSIHSSRLRNRVKNYAKKLLQRLGGHIQYPRKFGKVQETQMLRTYGQAIHGWQTNVSDPPPLRKEAWDESAAHPDVRIVSAAEGVLTLSPDFLADTRLAICAERNLCVALFDIDDQLEAAAILRKEVEALISQHVQAQLTTQPLKKRAPSIGLGEWTEAVIDHDTTATLDGLRLLLNDLKAEQESLRNSLLIRTEAYLVVQQKANAYLEAALVDAALVPAWIDVPVVYRPPREVATEVKRVRATRRDNASWSMNRDFVQNGEDQLPHDFSTFSREELVQAATQAWGQLRLARSEFATRDLTYARMLQQNQQDLEESGGVEGVDPDLFDLFWIKEVSKMTRALIDAEDNFENIKATMLSAGYDGEAGKLSGACGSDWTEMSAPGVEDNLIAAAPRDQIESWMDAMPGDFVSPKTEPEMPEVDEWSAPEVVCGEDQEPGPDVRRKMRIREWQHACHASDERHVSRASGLATSSDT